MQNDAGPNPLVNDLIREAVGPMRGYSYQILRSIDTWLELSDNEILVLEGAEDLDRIDASGALVEQVKDTSGSGNLTLRTGNAIAAIDNFWQHCSRNPGSAIQFRYLTTSGIGSERGEDLALSKPGIAAWEDIRRAPADAGSVADAIAIKDFLTGRKELSESLRSFLSKAPVEEFISRIVQPIEWVTDHPEGQELQRRIENRLIELGEQRGISAASASGALADLYLEAWTNASNPQRAPLRRGDFLRLFEAAGSTTIPTQQLVNLIKELTGGGAPKNEITPLDHVITGPPQTGRLYFPRPSLETRISAALRIGTVHLHGSTGMGKTTLAMSAIQGFPSTGWVDLRDLGPTSIGTRLDAAAQFLVGRRVSMAVVLDDMDATGDPRVFLPALGRLISSIREVGGFLLITSAQGLPPRLAAAVGLSEDRTFNAPPFETSEIAGYLGEAGCPTDNVDSWSKIVAASTSGHPQLVDARLGALKQQGWPTPSIREWLTPTSELVDARAEARQLVSMLPSDERELLSRASLVIGRISRARLIAVGAITPQVVEPGLAIDRVTGPWLEVTDTSDLRVSPLLRNLGTEIHGAAWTKNMHGAIAWAWLSDLSLSAVDVSTIMMHTTLHGQAGPLFHLLPSLLDAPADVWKQLGDAAGVFAMFGIDEGHQSPFSSPMDTALLRVLQLRIAMEGTTEQVEAVVRRALKEADDRKILDLGVSFFDFLFLWQLMGREGTSHTVQVAVDLSLRFKRLAEYVGNELVRLEKNDLHEIFTWPDLSPIVSFSLLRSISTVESFAAFLDLVEQLDTDDRRFLLPSKLDQLDAGAVALNQLWLNEVGGEDPDWIAFAALLERTYGIARDVQDYALAIAAAALWVRVTDEDIGDHNAALSLADRCASEIGGTVHLILAAKAKALWRSRAISEALELYEQILPDLSVQNPFRSEIFREAALTAARANLFPLCASRFEQAVANLGTEDAVARHVGYSFDLGLAHNLAGQQQDALKALVAAVSFLIDDGRDSPPEPLLSARQLGSQVLKILLSELKGENDDKIGSAQNFIGNASAIDILKWGDQVPATTALVANQLLELLLLVPGEKTDALRIAEWLRTSRDGLVLATSWENFTRLAVLTGEVAPLVSDTVTQLSWLHHLAGERAAGHDVYGTFPADPPPTAVTNDFAAFYYYRILIAIVTLMQKGEISRLPLSRWVSALPSDPSYDSMREFLTDIETVLLGAGDPWTKLTNGSDSWLDTAVAALGAMCRDRTAGELLIAQSVAAHSLNKAMLGNFVGDVFSELVAANWRKLIGTPALLVAPRVSVPALQSAISKPPGWRRTKAIFQAALLAVPSDVARYVRGDITALPDA